jgi:hypothetical protein
MGRMGSCVPRIRDRFGRSQGSLRLVAESKNVRLVAPLSGLDHTERMNGWTKEQTRRLN